MAQDTAREWLDRGISLFDAENYQEAESSFQEARFNARQSGDFHCEAHALVMLGECAFLRQDYTKTQNLTLDAKSIVDTHLRSDTISYYFLILQNLGVTASYLGRIDLQREYYNEALQFARDHHRDDMAMQADAYFNLAAAYYRSFALDSAMVWFDSTRAIAERIDYQSLIATTLLNQGVILAAWNDYDQAIRFQERALNLTEYPTERLLGLSNLADYYRTLGNMQTAYSYIDQAHELLVEEQLERQQYGSMLQLNACQVYYESGDTARYSNELQALLDWLPGNDPDFTADYQKAYNYLATLQLRRGQHANAEASCREALAVGADAFPEVTLGSYRLLAVALARQNRFEEGVRYLQRSIEIVAPSFSNLHFSNNPLPDQITNMELALDLLAIKLEILTSWARHSQRDEHYEAALATYELIEQLMRATRRQLRSRVSRIALGKQVRPVSYWATVLFHQLYERDGSDIWLKRAFQNMEQTRSLLLTEKLMNRRAITQLIPQELQDQERALASRSDYLRLLLSRTPETEENAAIRSQWQEELFIVEQSWDAFLDELETTYPAYHALKFDLPQVDLESLPAAILHPSEVLLSFVEGDSTIYVIAISAEGHEFKRLEILSPLSELVPSLQEALLNRSVAYYATASAIYQSLFAPLQDFIEGRDLVLMPDGLLWYLPYAALPIDQELPERPQNMRFLVQSSSIRLLFSAHSQLATTAKQEDRAFGHLIFGLAPLNTEELTTSGGVLPPLPGSAEELDRISAMHSAKTNYFLRGRKANKEAFIRIAPHAAILHIATHAILDDRDPNLSRLYFHPTANAPADSAALYAYELFQMNFQADLAVLSACRSGSGKLEHGEGLAGLSRAFALAGCPNLMVSQWPVNDEMGPVLMNEFYRELAAGVGKATALSRSQRKYLSSANPLALHPYYWAPFVAIGDNAPLPLLASFDGPLGEARRPFKWWGVGAIIVIIAAFLLWLIQRRRSVLAKVVQRRNDR